mgnify:CR=1 FL=1|jgi:cytochrome c6
MRNRRGNMPISRRAAPTVAWGVFIFLLALAAGPVQAGQQGISFGTLERLHSAKMLYQDNCAACHGYDGVPLLPGAANFSLGEKLDKTDGELLQIINLGGEEMPPWEDILTDLEQQEVLSYVRVLSGDQIYEARCQSCHETEAPRISGAADQSDAPADESPAGEFCSGSDVETDMTNLQFADIVKFLSQIYN